MSAGTSSGPSGLGAGGGECGALVRAHDWAATPLGPVERLAAGSLQTAASICLESRYGICVFWGPELVAIYNDAYVPMLGVKHPSAIGTPLRDIWPEIWDQIGPMLHGVVETGQATWQEDQPLLLERAATSPRRRYFTYSFSPIRGDAGEVAGVFTAVHETSRARDRDAPPGGARRARRGSRRGAHGAGGRRGGARGARRGARGRPVRGRCTCSTRTARAPSPGACGHASDRMARAAAAARPRASERRARGRDARRRAARRPARRSAAPAAALVLGASPHHQLDDDYRDFFRMVAAPALRARCRAPRAWPPRRRAPTSWPSSTAPRPSSSPTSRTSSARR